LHPLLFHIGNIALPTYGVLAATGLITGLWINVRMGVSDGLNEDKLWNLGVIAIMAAIVGSKLSLIAMDWDYYSKHLRELVSFSTLQSAGIWYGGVALGSIAAIAYMLIARLPVLRTFDAFAPGIAFGHALGRLGCFMAGCCYGRQTDLPWAVVFTDPLANKLSGTPLELPLHPTQLYEMVAELFLCALLLWLWPRRTAAGQIIGTWLFLYGIFRYFSEFLRDDPERGSMFNGLMTTTQFISILCVIAGGALWMRRSAKQTLASAE